MVDVEEHFLALINAQWLKRRGSNPSAPPRQDDDGYDEEILDYKLSPSHGDIGGDGGNDDDKTQPPSFDGVGGEGRGVIIGQASSPNEVDEAPKDIHVDVQQQLAVAPPTSEYVIQYSKH